MQVCERTLSWFEVPEEIKGLLVLAAESWEDRARSEQYVNQALAIDEAIGNDCLDVLVAAYRYFFYKNNNHLALQMALKVIARITDSECFPSDWEELKPILLGRKQEPQIRIYLSACAASSLVRARLGEIESALEIASRVKEIDDKNEFGAAVILDILTRPAEEDE